MNIKTIDLLECNAGWRNWLFVKITTDDGLVGYSECTESNGSHRAIISAIRELSPRVIGQDPMEIERIVWSLFNATRQSYGGVIQKAISGIENALWDIKGKALNLPVYKIYGGSVRTQLPVYWSHWGTTRVRAYDATGTKRITKLDDIPNLVRETKQRGFNCIKTNIIDFTDDAQVYMPGFARSAGWPELEVDNALINNLVRYIGKIREVGGEDFGIILDLNFNFKAEGYIRIARELERFKLTWLEMDNYDANTLGYISQSIPISVCSGENLFTNKQYKPYFEHNAMQVVSVDVLWNGWLQSRKIADLAEVFDLNVTPHNFYSHLATLISAHFAATIPNLKILEVDVDDVPWKDDIITAVPAISNGVLTLNDQPGWGANLNEEQLALHPIL